MYPKPLTPASHVPPWSHCVTCSNQVRVDVRKRKWSVWDFQMCHSKKFFLHLEIKRWPFQTGDLCSKVFYHDNLNFLKERGTKKLFFSPECCSVRSQGLDVVTFWNQWPGLRLEITAGSGLASVASGWGCNNHSAPHTKAY